jgi:hypothetical protein
MKRTEQKRPRRSLRKGENVLDEKVGGRNTENEERKGLGESQTDRLCRLQRPV